jgi:nucleoside-diphosphate-sugar epimerase
VARVALLSPDLLFGSRVAGALRAAGHEVTPVDDVAEAGGADALVVDLRDDVPSLAGLAGVPTLAVYSHVDQEMRRRAEDAGFDRVVPRSRMAREGAALVEALL